MINREVTLRRKWPCQPCGKRKKTRQSNEKCSSWSWGEDWNIFSFRQLTARTWSSPLAALLLIMKSSHAWNESFSLFLISNIVMRRRTHSIAALETNSHLSVFFLWLHCSASKGWNQCLRSRPSSKMLWSSYSLLFVHPSILRKLSHIKVLLERRNQLSLLQYFLFSKWWKANRISQCFRETPNLFHLKEMKM